VEWLGLLRQCEKIAGHHGLLAIRKIITESDYANPHFIDASILFCHSMLDVLVQVGGIMLYHLQHVTHAAGCINTENQVHGIGQLIWFHVLLLGRTEISHLVLAYKGILHSSQFPFCSGMILQSEEDSSEGRYLLFVEKDTQCSA
jgi:hypothetical protein